MRRLLLIFTLINALNAFSTAQIPDILFYNGDTLVLYSNPLEEYINKNPSFKLIDFDGCGSTACWKGYRAIWEIRNDSIFLERITSCNNLCGIKTTDANLLKMFGSEKVFASWITEKLKVVKGDRIKYIHMGYSSIFEYEQFFVIKNGKLKREYTISVYNTKRIKYNYKKDIAYSVKLSDTIYKLINSINWKEYDDSLIFCFDLYRIKFKINGTVKNVLYHAYNNEKKIQIWWWNLTEKDECREIIKKSICNYRSTTLKNIKRRKIVYYIDYDKKSYSIDKDKFI